jgi:hypothetical protein
MAVSLVAHTIGKNKAKKAPKKYWVAYGISKK